jgi:hypothetical protein
MAEFQCKDKKTAFAVLDTISTTLTGTQSAAIAAVRRWIDGNIFDLRDFDGDFSKLTDEELEQIARRAPGNPAVDAGYDWFTHAGWRLGIEPPDGALWPCIWDAKTKRWELPELPDQFTPPPDSKKPQNEREGAAIASEGALS